MVVLTDGGFHAKEGDPENLKLCKRGSWGVRTLIETVNSHLSGVFSLKNLTERTEPYLTARLSFVTAAYNLLIQWNGMQPDERGLTPLTIAQFTQRSSHSEK